MVLVSVSCEYHSTDDLVMPVESGDAVRYATNVRPIIENNCYTCHGPTPIMGAPMSLTSYALLRQAVEERGLIGRISLPDGHADLMPLGGPRLPQPSIDRIVKWQQDGFPE